MNVLETIGVFVLIPAAVYGLLAILTLRSKFAPAPRYRPGQGWPYPPVWWSANPEGLSPAASHDDSAPDAEAVPHGGARGSW